MEYKKIDIVFDINRILEQSSAMAALLASTKDPYTARPTRIDHDNTATLIPFALESIMEATSRLWVTPRGSTSTAHAKADSLLSQFRSPRASPRRWLRWCVSPSSRLWRLTSSICSMPATRRQPRSKTRCANSSGKTFHALSHRSPSIERCEMRQESET